MDELGPLQPIPRGGRSWGPKAQRRPNRYPRTGTVQWLAAFNPHSGQSVGKAYQRKRSEDVLDFLENVLLPCYPGKHIYMIWDNLSSHRSQRTWQNEHGDRISLIWLPTNSPWLNLIESYFSVLCKLALHNTDYKTTDEISDALEKATEYLNENPRKYSWNYI